MFKTNDLLPKGKRGIANGLPRCSWRSGRLGEDTELAEPEGVDASSTCIYKVKESQKTSHWHCKKPVSV